MYLVILHVDPSLYSSQVLTGRSTAVGKQAMTEAMRSCSLLPCQPRRQSLVWAQMKPSAQCLAAPGRRRAGKAAVPSRLPPRQFPTVLSTQSRGAQAESDSQHGGEMTMEPILWDGSGTGHQDQTKQFQVD